ncbi:MAG: Ig-like domain-containing protein, partial [Candidatus Limnocylindria bacterium]|nr:Ig-like domain-containing protein [Candidatus Limnocylindria bacterium]
VAGLRVPLMPYAPADYAPSWVEWSILGAAFGLFALIISVFVKLFPVISIWEVIEHRGPEPAPPGASWAPAPAGAALGARIMPILVIAGSVAGFLLGGQAGADDRKLTQIAVAVPSQVALGQTIEAQARLTDASGAAVPKATIAFTTASTFLGVSDEAVLAEATTDKGGVASAEFDLRAEGTFEVRAAFRGDDRYGPVTLSLPITVTGDAQLYVQRAGVLVPGLNAAPPQVPAAEPFWPALSGWPIALVLITVWSLYAFVALLVARIARMPEVP